MGGTGSGGHNFKPRIVKLREHTYRRDRDRNSPEAAPKRPSRPSWILPEAKREWNRIVPQLERLGLLTELDRSLLAGYCQAWGRYVQAQRELAKAGLTYVNDRGQVKRHPVANIADNYAEEMRKIALQFGLTPSSRGRITFADQEERDDGLLD